MKNKPRMGEKRGKGPARRTFARRAKPATARTGPVPPGMIRLRNGRLVREGEVVVYVRLRKGGAGVYILSEDLIHLPADALIGLIEIDRGIDLNSPLVLHPEVE